MKNNLFLKKSLHSSVNICGMETHFCHWIKNKKGNCELPLSIAFFSYNCELTSHNSDFFLRIAYYKLTILIFFFSELR